MTFAQVYRARQDIRFKLKSTARTMHPDKWWKLKDEEKRLSLLLDQMMAMDKKQKSEAV